VVTAGGAATVTEIDADFVGSVRDVAVTVTAKAAVTGVGAVKTAETTPTVETLPQADAEQEAFQVTPAFDGSFATPADKVTVRPSSTV